MRGVWALGVASPRALVPRPSYGILDIPGLVRLRDLLLRGCLAEKMSSTTSIQFQSWP